MKSVTITGASCSSILRQSVGTALLCSAYEEDNQEGNPLPCSAVLSLIWSVTHDLEIPAEPRRIYSSEEI
jgi:hypothetical protein